MRDDYYQSEHKNIFFEDLNEQWEVMWYEDYKWHAKPFPVKKWGLEAAKREALAFFETVKHMSEPWRDQDDTRLNVPGRAAFDRENIVGYFPMGHPLGEKSPKSITPTETQEPKKTAEQKATQLAEKKFITKEVLDLVRQQGERKYWTPPEKYTSGPAIPLMQDFNYSGMPPSVQDTTTRGRKTTLKKLAHRRNERGAVPASVENVGYSGVRGNPPMNELARTADHSAEHQQTAADLFAGMAEYGGTGADINVCSQYAAGAGRAETDPSKLYREIYNDDTVPVQFDHRMQSWTVFYYDEKGRPKTKCYSARKWGNQVARDKAFQVYQAQCANIF